MQVSLKARARSGRLVAALAVAALGTGLTPAERPALLVISIDGLHPRLVREADALGWRLPNLSRLARSGASARAVTGVLPTLTYPSHATLVTGVSPKRHGIVSNRPLDTTGTNGAGWYWFAEDLQAPALWDVAAEAGIATAAVDWPVTVGARLTWNVAQFWRASPYEDVRLRRALSTPGLLAEMEAVLGPYPSGEAFDVASDRRRADFGVELLRRHRPGLQLAYFSGFDEAQHSHGPGSPEARAALEAIDVLVGRLQAAAREHDRPARVAVVSDHGFAASEVAVDVLEALRRAGLARLGPAGQVEGWRAHPLVTEGSAAFYLDDPSDQAAAVRLHAMAAALASDARLGVAEVLDRDALARRGGFPGAELAITLRPGHRFEEALSGSLWRPERCGTHGFGPAEAEMDATFLIAGPGIPAGVDLGRVDMRDVAPTLAAQIGLRLPQAEGHDLSPRLRPHG